MVRPCCGRAAAVLLMDEAHFSIWMPWGNSAYSYLHAPTSPVARSVPRDMQLLFPPRNASPQGYAKRALIPGIALLFSSSSIAGRELVILGDL